MAKMKDIEAAADAAQWHKDALTPHDKMAVQIIDRLSNGVRTEFGYEAHDPAFSRLPVGNLDARQKKISDHVVRGRDEQTYLFGYEAKSAKLGTIEIQLMLEPVSATKDGRSGQGWELRYHDQQLAVLFGDAPLDVEITETSVLVTNAVHARIARGKKA